MNNQKDLGNFVNFINGNNLEDSKEENKRKYLSLLNKQEDITISEYCSRIGRPLKDLQVSSTENFKEKILEEE